MKPEKTKINEYLNYSAINFGTSLLTITASTYILYYYTDVLLLPLQLVTVLLFVCRIFDGAIDPVIGFYMDRRHNKFGKYRGYIIIFALPVCILYVALFSPPPLTGMYLAIYCFVIYLFIAFAQSMVECAHRPLLITINDNPAQRRASNTAKIALGILASLASSYLFLILVNKMGSGSERRGFALAMSLFALVALVAILPGALRLKERNITLDNTLSLKQTIYALIHDKRLLLLFTMYFCSQVGNSAKSQATVYYMKYNLNRADLTAVILMIGVLSSFLTQPLIVWAAKRTKTITLIIAGYIGGCLGFAVIGISGQSIVLLFAGNILFGIASAFPGNLIHAYTADLAEELSAQNSFGGLVTSLLGLSSRVGQSLSGVIISVVLYITAYTPNAMQNPAALFGIWGCLSALTFLSYLIAAITAGASRRMTEKQHAQ